MPKKVTPNNVSGRVVKALSIFPLSVSKSISVPFDFPIQFICMFLTFSGQSISSRPDTSSSA